MACAPRGISSTKSASVGRTMRNFSPRVETTYRPSDVPMIGSCGSFPPRRSLLPPALSVMRYRRSLRPMRRTGSPGRSGPARMRMLGRHAARFHVLAHPAHDRLERGPRGEDFRHAGALQGRDILLGGDPTAEDHDVAGPLLPQPLDDAPQ